MKKIHLFLIAVLAAFAVGHAAVYSPESVPDVHRANRNAFTSNPDGILSAPTVAYIDSALQSLRRTLSVEAMVVAVDAIEDPDDPSLFATDLFEHWGLGKTDKDNGLLILLVKDARSVQIRTGYGLEGVLPDVVCSRIIREVMKPAFRQGNYDAGMAGGVAMIDRILTDPQYREEIQSSMADSDNKADTEDDAFAFYITVICIMTVVMLVCFGAELVKMRNAGSEAKYRRFAGWKPYYLIATFGGIGIPLAASLPLLLCLYHWRNHRRKCPNCGTVMGKVDEVHDNDYLTPSQDLEERIGSVDYDVWLCPKCGETDIIPYATKSSPYVECDHCHARTAKLVRDRILTKPTSRTEGSGVREYHCLNCGNDSHRNYKIPRTASDELGAMASGAVLGSMLGSGGRRSDGGGFGGGGFSGGDFGGGSTGGGGAGDSW